LLRKTIFWLHLTAGVIAGVVILIMSLTGVLLTYEKQMIAWADRSDAALPPAPGAARLSVDALLAAAVAGDGDARVTNLTISSVPGAPALATVGTRTLTLNPYTGAVLGESAPTLRPFFRTVTTWHRYLGAANGPLRQSMRAVTGWSNFLFLLIVLGGVYLWLPRRWSWNQVRAVVWFRGGLRGKARDFNWHNAIGIWCAVPLALVVLGAMPISFPWANRAVYQLVGEDPPAPAGQGPQAAGRGGRAGGAREGGGPLRGGEARPGRPAEPAAALEPVWQRVEQQAGDDWRTIGARVGGNGPVAFTVDRGYGGQPQLRTTLTMDRATGEVVRAETFDQQSTGRQLRSFLRFAHTGEYFGLTGQTIAGIASLGGVVLVWTGIALALRRFSAWRKRRAIPASQPLSRSNAA
jgi:uncharacterized iron-regulated membrane protein